MGCFSFHMSTLQEVGSVGFRLEQQQQQQQQALFSTCLVC